MKIIEFGEKEAIWHCIICEDAKDPKIRRVIDKLKKDKNIEDVASGIHEKCYAVYEKMCGLEPEE